MNLSSNDAKKMSTACLETQLIMLAVDTGAAHEDSDLVRSLLVSEG